MTLSYDNIRRKLKKLSLILRSDVTFEAWRPIQFGPEPVPFTLIGKILRRDKEPRVLSLRSGSFQITINPEWAEHLPKALVGHFFQTPKYRGVIFIGPEDALSITGGENGCENHN